MGVHDINEYTVDYIDCRQKSFRQKSADEMFSTSYTVDQIAADEIPVGETCCL